MGAERFIAGKLKFQGRMAVAAIAISFLVMIIAVSVTGGFRKEIRRGVSELSGDVLLSGPYLNYYSESDPVDAEPSYLPRLMEMRDVEKITPVVYRAGIAKGDADIHGILFKGMPGADSTSLGARIPSKLANLLGLEVGSPLLTYFVGERVKVRKFTVTDIYESLLDADGSMLVYTSMEDLQRLNGWDSTQVSALEMTLSDKVRSRNGMKMAAAEAGSIALCYAEEEEESLVATSTADRYGQLFDWLDLIDFNVVAILILMTIVAGVNMISGLLIMFLRNVSTIGTLKAMGMQDKGISAVFLRLSGRAVLAGMAAGNILALAFCMVQKYTHVLKLDPQNYFVSFVPININLPLILAADAISFAAIMALLLIPTLFVAKVDPAQTVKAE